MARRTGQSSYPSSSRPVDSHTGGASKSGTWWPSAAGTRETIESIVIAFVLAFLFRTFEAEAFVIPTGSMAPTLMGRHKDLYCPECGYPYQVSASDEVFPNGVWRGPQASVISSICPQCRFVADLSSQNPQRISYPSFKGDRILVGKFFYEFGDPQRWDVSVFKFPGDAKINYIKRLVGLPNETIRLRGGDVFVKKEGSQQFEIARKPPRKLVAMLQPVYDQDYVVPELVGQGWPLRWAAVEGQEKNWEYRDQYRTLVCHGGQATTQWIRYRHLVPSAEQWYRLKQHQSLADTPPQAQLITDFCAYNTGRDRDASDRDPFPRLEPYGQHWVGDLALECELDCSDAEGAVVLQLVKGGRRFQCRINLADGVAAMSIEGMPHFSPQATTKLRKQGKHQVRFSNIDNELLLWVDGYIVSFNASTRYEGLGNDTPREGDYLPAAIGIEKAGVRIRHLRLMRDLYYIPERGRTMPDYRAGTPPEVEFPLAADQFLALGDNSARSKDSRLWEQDSEYPGGPPLEYYVKRELLLGKALFIYWPHSWDKIRLGSWNIPFPFFPNYGRMRPVR